MSELRVRHPAQPFPPPPPDSDEPYGAWLTRRLKAQRMTQRQLASRTGVNHSTISRLAAGREPMYHTARAIAKVLGWPHSRGSHI